MRTVESTSTPRSIGRVDTSDRGVQKFVAGLTPVERGKILLEMEMRPANHDRARAHREAVQEALRKASQPDPDQLLNEVEEDINGRLQILLPKLSLAGRMLLVLFGRELQQPGFISDLLLNVAPASGFGTRCYKSLGLRTLGGA